MSDWRAYARWTGIGVGVRWTDTELYSKVDSANHITYYAVAPIWTSINSPKWSLMKVFDDWTYMRRSYPLSYKWFNDYNPVKVWWWSDRYDAFDPSDPDTYNIYELQFTTEFLYKASELDLVHYWDIMDTIIT